MRAHSPLCPSVSLERSARGSEIREARKIEVSSVARQIKAIQRRLAKREMPTKDGMLTVADFAALPLSGAKADIHK